MIVGTSRAAALAANAEVILFDFDGTIANTPDGIRFTAVNTLRSLGWSDERIGDVNRLIGPPFPAAFSQVYGVDAQEAEKITHLYRETYKQLGPEACMPYPGIPELLEHLAAAGKPMGLATCKQEQLACSMARAQGLDGYFSQVVANQPGQSIDKVQIVAGALQAFDVRPREAVMIGDRADDVRGAQANGVTSIGVTWGAGDASELRDAGADLLVDTPSELEEVLLGP